MNIMNKIILYMLCLNINSIQAFVTVGNDIDCDFQDLQSAYLDNDPLIRATNQFIFTDDFVITKTKQFTGGYNNCTDANANIISIDRSEWRDATFFKPVIKINANQPTVAMVILDNFRIVNGQDVNPGGAGGIKIQGNTSLILNNSTVNNSSADLGGGILISGAMAQLTLNDSDVLNNIAYTNGGGIYCEDQAQVWILGNSSVGTNLSYGKGGGIFATGGCQINIESGDSSVVGEYFDNLGIVNNQAQQGGGVYLELGSQLTLTGNDEHPASILANSATGVQAKGGGIYLTGVNTSFSAINARIEQNSALNTGAGIYAGDQSSFSMDRKESNCWNNNKCSSLSANFTGLNGSAAAAYIGTSVQVDIAQTHLVGNKANETVLFYLEKFSKLRLEGSLMSDNGGLVDTANNMFTMNGANTGATIEFYYNTLTDNNTNTIFNLIGSNDFSINDLKINNSIIWDQGDIITTSGNFAPVVSLDCVVVHEVNSLVGSIAFTNTDNPLFINPSEQDYHLSASSSAIDFCSELYVQSQHTDLNGLPRGFDVTSVDNNLGAFDAGAYEFSSQFNSDVIFKNGFD